MAAITSAALVAGATVYSTSQQSKAAREARRAGEAAQIDPDEVANRAREQGIRSLRESFEAEQMFAPENATFRRSSLANLQRQLNEDDSAVLAELDRDIAAGGTAERSNLLSDAIARASADLEMGGRLDRETRNQVTRAGLARSARTGGGRLDLAQYIVPRDLGLTSLDLAQRRLSTAGQFGQIEQSANQADFDNLLRLRETRERFGTNRFNRGYSLAAFGQQMTPPQVGLSAGDYASLFTNNASNAATAGMNSARLRAQQGQNVAESAAAFGGLAGAVGDRFFQPSAN